MDLGTKYQGKIATIVVVLYQKSFVKHGIGFNIACISCQKKEIPNILYQFDLAEN